MSNKHLNGYIKENDDDIYHATHYPTCRFCGKQTIPTARYESDADADEAATMACDCYDARQYREQKAQAERREKNIAKLKSSIKYPMYLSPVRILPTFMCFCFRLILQI